MDSKEAHEVLASALEGVRASTYEELLARAPLLTKRTRLLGFTLSETFRAKDGGYVYETRSAPSGVQYNVTTEVFWADYDTQVIGVMVCVDDGGESARRPLCEMVERDPPGVDQRH